jgi:1,2-diacylglycerol-3-alpha-glucose alpha-1,2-galactosyltransferase
MKKRSRPLRINMVSESVYGFQGQGVHTAFVNFMAMLKNKKGVEILVNSKEPCDILHCHTLGPLYWMLRGRSGGKRVMSAHVVPGSIEGSIVGWKLWGPLFNRYMVAAYNSADLVIPVAPAVKRVLAEIGVKSRQEMLPNPIDLGAFKPSAALRAKGRKRLGLKPGAKVALCVGQIQPRKGVSDFLQSAAAHPEIHFVWAGGRPFSVLTEAYMELNSQIKAAGPNVHFPGILGLDVMPEIYNAADVFYFPSFQENCALAIAEAAACGLPLLLRELSDYRELYGKGYLTAGDQAGFRDQLKNVFSKASLRQSYRRQSIAMAKNFSSRHLADELLALYEELA